MMRRFISILEAPLYTRFNGFGGRCGPAAVAINRVIFGGRGQIVGAFNKAFFDAGRLTGHVAVKADGAFWDSDARPKTADEIESWGMLDLDDPDYAAFAAQHGIAWNDETASEVDWFAMSERETLKAFGHAPLEEMMRHLGWKGTNKRI